MKPRETINTRRSPMTDHDLGLLIYVFAAAFCVVLALAAAAG